MGVVDAGRAEWLARRKLGIGGSDIAAIMGLSPWQSPYSLWVDKVGPVGDETDSPAMEFGRRAEGMLADWFQDATGLFVAGEQTECVHPDHPWMRCTIDGYVYEGVGEDAEPIGGVEYKTTSEPKWVEVPAHYACQAQWTMAVTGLPVVWFGVLHIAFGRPEFHVYPLTRDENDIELCTKTASAFWFNHVVTGIAPPTDGTEATRRALGEAWDGHTEEPVDASPDVATAIARLHAAKATVAQAEHRVAELENEIKAFMADATVLHVDGRPAATWKPQTAERFDTATFRKAWPDLAREFTKTSESRVFRLKTSKENP